MNGVEIPLADDETGNGYVIEEGKVRLVGDARPNAAYGRTEYKLEVLYSEPLSIQLPVGPLVTGDSSYCDNETGSVMSDVELVENSQQIRLNGVLLTLEQYHMDGNRVILNMDQVTIQPGNNTLTTDYQVRQGTNFEDNKFTFQVGGNTGNHKTVNIASFDHMLMDISAVCVRTADHAEIGLGIIDRSMDFILSGLGNIGAAENSFDHIASNLHVSKEGLTAALSRIEDVDIANELMNTVKLQLLAQAQQALSSQSNHRQESVLELLR